MAVLRKRPSSGIKDEELGVHLVNAELQEVYDSYCQRNPVAVNETCSMLFERCSVPAEKKVYAYVLFTILHEIGHWKHLIQSGLSSMDYWKNMKPVGILYGWIFNVNTLFVKTIFSVKKLLHALTRSIEICHPKDLLMNMQFGNYRNICKICGCGSLY